MTCTVRADELLTGHILDLSTHCIDCTLVCVCVCWTWSIYKFSLFDFDVQHRDMNAVRSWATEIAIKDGSLPPPPPTPPPRLLTTPPRGATFARDMAGCNFGAVWILHTGSRDSAEGAPRRAIRFSKILSDFCSRCLIHRILHLKRPGKSIRSEKWKLSGRKSGHFIRAGNFRYFFIFSLIKNVFFALFIKLITYFCTSPI